MSGNVNCVLAKGTHRFLRKQEAGTCLLETKRTVPGSMFMSSQ